MSEGNAPRKKTPKKKSTSAETNVTRDSQRTRTPKTPKRSALATAINEMSTVVREAGNGVLRHFAPQLDPEVEVLVKRATKTRKSDTLESLLNQTNFYEPPYDKLTRDLEAYGGLPMAGFETSVVHKSLHRFEAQMNVARNIAQHLMKGKVTNPEFLDQLGAQVYIHLNPEVPLDLIPTDRYVAQGNRLRRQYSDLARRGIVDLNRAHFINSRRGVLDERSKTSSTPRKPAPPSSSSFIPSSFSTPPTPVPVSRLPSPTGEEFSLPVIKYPPPEEPLLAGEEVLEATKELEKELLNSAQIPASFPSEKALRVRDVIETPVSRYMSRHSSPEETNGESVPTKTIVNTSPRALSVAFTNKTGKKRDKIIEKAVAEHVKEGEDPQQFLNQLDEISKRVENASSNLTNLRITIAAPQTPAETRFVDRVLGPLESQVSSLRARHLRDVAHLRESARRNSAIVVASPDINHHSFQNNTPTTIVVRTSPEAVKAVEQLNSKGLLLSVDLEESIPRQTSPQEREEGPLPGSFIPPEWTSNNPDDRLDQLTAVANDVIGGTKLAISDLESDVSELRDLVAAEHEGLRLSYEGLNTRVGETYTRLQDIVSQIPDLATKANLREHFGQIANSHRALGERVDAMFNDLVGYRQQVAEIRRIIDDEEVVGTKNKNAENTRRLDEIKALLDEERRAREGRDLEYSQTQNELWGAIDDLARRPAIPPEEQQQEPEIPAEVNRNGDNEAPQPLPEGGHFSYPIDDSPGLGYRATVRHIEDQQRRDEAPVSGVLYSNAPRAEIAQVDPHGVITASPAENKLGQIYPLLGDDNSQISKYLETKLSYLWRTRRDLGSIQRILGGDIRGGEFGGLRVDSALNNPQEIDNWLKSSRETDDELYLRHLGNIRDQIMSNQTKLIQAGVTRGTLDGLIRDTYNNLQGVFKSANRGNHPYLHDFARAILALKQSDSTRDGRIRGLYSRAQEYINAWNEMGQEPADGSAEGAAFSLAQRLLGFREDEKKLSRFENDLRKKISAFNVEEKGVLDTLKTLNIDPRDTKKQVADLRKNVAEVINVLKENKKIDEENKRLVRQELVAHRSDVDKLVRSLWVREPIEKLPGASVKIPVGPTRSTPPAIPRPTAPVERPARRAASAKGPSPLRKMVASRATTPLHAVAEPPAKRKPGPRTGFPVPRRRRSKSVPGKRTKK